MSAGLDQPKSGASADRGPVRTSHNTDYVCDPSDHRSALWLALAQAISLTTPTRPSGRFPSPPSTPRRPRQRRKSGYHSGYRIRMFFGTPNKIKGLERICS